MQYVPERTIVPYGTSSPAILLPPLRTIRLCLYEAPLVDAVKQELGGTAPATC
jgi:hypothetical protein